MSHLTRAPRRGVGSQAIAVGRRQYAGIKKEMLSEAAA